ncbi:MAG: hypothetical protein GY752_02660 [bacterium]|nr:hypothetical protein [bacterium]MCP4799363.1 hypothetical protein [bacterium]
MLRKFLTLSVHVILLAVMVKPVISAQIVSPGDLLNNSVDRAELSAKVDIGKKLWQSKPSVVQHQRLNGRSAPDSLHAIILICDFQDYKFYGQWDEMDQDLLLNPYGDFYYTAHDSLYYGNQFANVATYFDEVSGSQFTLDYDVCGTVATLPNDMGWYGNHPDEGEQRFLLVQHTVEILDQYVDFSNYDTVILVHADAGEETDVNGDSPEQIHSSYLGEADFEEAYDDTILTQPWIETADDAIVNKVLVLPEYEFQDFDHPYGGPTGSLGVYCFVVGQRLGMLPLFDPTPGGSPDSAGIGNFGLMGYGLFLGGGLIPSHPCAYNKVLMGWLEPYTVLPNQVEELFYLFPAEHPGVNTCARVEISSSEYFLLEYRLQDPDDNGIFSFGDDKNSNGIPDFYDVSEPGGLPTWGVSFFDATEDSIETLVGSEFDFFMSDNTGRPEGVKGAGSGIYIWHIDEWVINNIIQSGSSAFNGDSQRKAVDLEEADGIQDLDAMRGIYVLGGDYDSYRQEDYSSFTPETLPNTDTAGGVRTGIVIDNISALADSMTFNCSIVSTDSPIELISDIQMPGIDLSGCHLLAVDLDNNGTLEIITTAGNTVYAFNADGSEYFTVTVDDVNDEEVAWSGSPAAGDFNNDGYSEIVLSSNVGVFAFDREGVWTLLYEMDDCPLPPMLTDTGSIVVVEYQELLDEYRLLIIGHEGERLWSLIMPAGVVTGVPPVLWDDYIVLPISDEEAGSSVLICRPEESHILDLPVEVCGYQMYCNSEQLFIPLDQGALATVFKDNLQEVVLWENRVDVASSIAPGLFFTSNDVFASTGQSGHYQVGWPARPRSAITATDFDNSPTPLVYTDLAGNEFVLFTSSDGRLFLYDKYGGLVDGWPLAGAGTPAGTAILVDIDSDSVLELVVASATNRLSASIGEESIGELVSRLMFYRLTGTDGFTSKWSMSGGSPTRSGFNVETGESGDGLIELESVVCYPSPLTSGTLFVRAESLGECDFQAVLYNLEGEEVARSDVRNVSGVEPVEVELVVDHIASGLYVCRVIASDGDVTKVLVKSVAVAR